MPVKLPYQNHAGGFDLRLCSTTLEAYLKRSVAPAKIFGQKNRAPDFDHLVDGTCLVFE